MNIIWLMLAGMFGWAWVQPISNISIMDILSPEMKLWIIFGAGMWAGWVFYQVASSKFDEVTTPWHAWFAGVMAVCGASIVLRECAFTIFVGIITNIILVVSLVLWRVQVICEAWKITPETERTR